LTIFLFTSDLRLSCTSALTPILAFRGHNQKVASSNLAPLPNKINGLENCERFPNPFFCHFLTDF